MGKEVIGKGRIAFRQQKSGNVKFFDIFARAPAQAVPFLKYIEISLCNRKD